MPSIQESGERLLGYTKQWYFQKKWRQRVVEVIRNYPFALSRLELRRSWGCHDAGM